MLASIRFAAQYSGAYLSRREQVPLWLNLVALLIGLMVLLRRARTRGNRPLILATIASIAILTGKFEFASTQLPDWEPRP